MQRARGPLPALGGGQRGEALRGQGGYSARDKASEKDRESAPASQEDGEESVFTMEKQVPRCGRDDNNCQIKLEPSTPAGTRMPNADAALGMISTVLCGVRDGGRSRMSGTIMCSRWSAPCDERCGMGS